MYFANNLSSRKVIFFCDLKITEQLYQQNTSEGTLS